MLLALSRGRVFGVARRFCSAPKEICVLGIETSCDDTALAVVSSTRGVLADVRQGQWALSQQWGGIHPGAAALEHTRVIGGLAQKALANADLTMKEITAIAVTAGPGMPFSLEAGLNFAKQLSRDHPHATLLPINHLEAHAVSTMMTNPSLTFPFLTLLISGGHTVLWVANGLGDHQMVGETLDDALGEALDKAGKMVGIQPRPGEPMGAALTRFALSNPNPPSFQFPIPMQHKLERPCEFSFAGLKTSLMHKLSELHHEALSAGKEVSMQQKVDVAGAFLEACMRHLEFRLKHALIWVRKYRPEINHVALCGGCAASSYIRDRLTKLASVFKCTLVAPALPLCGDNGVMIADLGLRRFLVPGVEGASHNISYHSRWPVGPRIPNFDAQALALKPSKKEQLRQKKLAARANNIRRSNSSPRVNSPRYPVHTSSQKTSSQRPKP